MTSVRSGSPRQYPRWPVLPSVRLVVAVVTALSLATVDVHSGIAQSGGSYTYTEDGLEWSVSYDDSFWAEGSSDLADLTLQSDGEQFVQFVTLPDNDGGAAGCLAAMIELFEELGEVTGAATYETEDGEPAIGETDATAWEIRTISLDGRSGQAVHACWAIGDSAALWAIGLVPEGSGDLASVYTLFDAVSIDGEPVPIGLPLGDTSGASAADATPDGSEGGEDEATPGVGDGSGDGDGNGAGDGSGADEEAGTYLAPTFGYSVAFDPSAWSVLDEMSPAEDDYPRDFLALETEDNTSRLYVEGSDAEWIDTDDCLDVLIDESLIDSTESELLDGPDGEPYEIREDGRSAIAYLSPIQDRSADPAERVVLVDCREDPARGVIVGFTNFSVSNDPYFDGTFPDVETVIDSLVFRGGPDGEESTPVANP